MKKGIPPPACHVSCVTCHISHVECIFFSLQSCEFSQWRVCYQRGIPRLVFNRPHVAWVVYKHLCHKLIKSVSHSL